MSLQDRVYTFGGYWKNGTQSDVAFMFKANVWSQVGTLQAKRMCAGAVRYENQLYLVGGLQEDQVSPLQIERWDLDEHNEITGQEFIGEELTNFFKPFLQLVPADFCVKPK